MKSLVWCHLRLLSLIDVICQQMLDIIAQFYNSRKISFDISPRASLDIIIALFCLGLISALEVSVNEICV